MRKAYLDNIRWTTVLLVVVYHVVYMYNGEGVAGGLGKITRLDVQHYDLYAYAVYPWFMLVLFIVSGMCARFYLESHAPGEFARSRTRRLLVPATVGLFTFQFLQGAVSMALAGAFDSLRGVPVPVRYLIMALSGQGVLWYAQTLWIFSMLLLPLRKIERDRLWRLGGRADFAALLLMAVPVWAASLVLNTPVVVVYRFGLYGAAFFLGYFVLSHDTVIEVLKRRFLPLLLLSLALGCVFCLRSFGKNWADAPVNRSPLFAAYGWCASLAVIGGMARYGDRSTPLTEWMRRRSFGLYVFHYLGISLTALLLAGRIPAPLVYLLSLAAGLASGYGLNALVSRIPLLRWCVLGLSGKG